MTARRFVLPLVLLPVCALAQARADRPTLQAVRVTAAPALDGNVLDDPTWANVPATTEFWQTTPDDGVEASERTEVRVVYTETTLYIGVVCHDRTPASIAASDSRRDSSLDDTDSFRVILDTYRDGQNGFVFGTNPAGIEYDGQVAREGLGGDTGQNRQQAGSGGGFNLNWDGAWQVRSHTGDFGWSAEFAIPFRTLRYRPDDDTWGINFQRNIQRRNEKAYWAKLDRQYTIFRLSDAGAVTGLEVPAQRNLKLAPYGLVSGSSVRGAGDDRDVDVGIDGKWSVTPSLTLDATVNTDFAQVEVDEEQINLDRFNLFFPEKRPFFLENAGLFSVGLPGDVELFFSRRIGIADDGTVIPIRGGGRLTGKVGGVNVGLLNMQTARVGDTVPSANYSVARVSRDLPNRSSVGVLFTNRTATGTIAEDGDHGQTYAADARFGIGARGTVQGFVARTASPDTSGREAAFNLSGRYESRGLRLTGGFTQIGDAFAPQVGFLSRKGYRAVESGIFRTIRLAENRFRFLELRPHINYRAFWNFDRFQETGFIHIDNHWAFRAGHELHTGFNMTKEGVVTPFPIYPGVVVPAGTYDHKEAQIVGFTNKSAPVWLDGQLRAGGFFGGDRVATTIGINARTSETLNASVYWVRNDVDLPWGSFETNLVRTRVSYSFSPSLYLQALLQYNDRAQIWSTNLRFGWVGPSNTGLFVVFNDTQDLDDLSTRRVGRSLVVKYSRLIDVLR